MHTDRFILYQATNCHGLRLASQRCLTRLECKCQKSIFIFPFPRGKEQVIFLAYEYSVASTWFLRVEQWRRVAHLQRTNHLVHLVHLTL